MQSLEEYAGAFIGRAFAFLDWLLTFAIKYMWVIALAFALKAAKGVFRFGKWK